MLLYTVQWNHSKTLSKGKGRVTRNESSFCFTCLCRNNHDALRCLDYHFRVVFPDYNKHGLTIEDGTIELRRTTIDSRGFEPRYLLLDGMREPFNLIDPKSNCTRLHKLF